MKSKRDQSKNQNIEKLKQRIYLALGDEYETPGMGISGLNNDCDYQRLLLIRKQLRKLEDEIPKVKQKIMDKIKWSNKND